MLQSKIAIIYGAGGAVGSAIAKEFVNQGAHVALVGRTLSTLTSLQASLGSQSEFAVLDVFDAAAVSDHLTEVIQRHGKLDASVNVIGLNDNQGRLLKDLTTDFFIEPILAAMKAHHITTTAASRRMISQGYGTLLALSANAVGGVPGVGGFGVACSALESLYRQLSAELGPHGIRTGVIRSAGSPEAPGLREVFENLASKAGLSLEEFEKRMAGRFALRRFPRLKEIGDTAAFLASDFASVSTGIIFNATCGSMLDN